MNKIIIVFGLLLVILAGIAFYQYNVNRQPQAQMKPTGKVTINAQIFNVEVVKDVKAQEVGLTKYNSIQPDQGMLFIFPKPGMYGFWMRGMKFPIDIVFMNNNKVVSTVENIQPVSANTSNIPIYQPGAPSDSALEIQAGLVKKYNVKTGDAVEIKI